jgi:hypothetical protein
MPLSAWRSGSDTSASKVVVVVRAVKTVAISSNDATAMVTGAKHDLGGSRAPRRSGPSPRHMSARRFVRKTIISESAAKTPTIADAMSCAKLMRAIP